MLVHRAKEKKVFWVFDSIIMQNMRHNLLLFCAATWKSYHMTENHLYFCERNFSAACFDEEVKREHLVHQIINNGQNVTIRWR